MMTAAVETAAMSKEPPGSTEHQVMAELVWDHSIYMGLFNDVLFVRRNLEESAIFNAVFVVAREQWHHVHDTDRAVVEN